MASPRTPAAPDGSANFPGSLEDLRKHLASQGGGSLPTTPAKLADLDPAILLSVKSRNSLTAPKSPGFSQHLRNTSTSSVVTVTKYNSGETGRAMPAHLERNWRNVNDPFVASPEATTAMSSERLKADEEKQEDGSTVGSPTPKPREDRDSSNISAENAQGFFKANSCIFVANLAVGRNDQDLEADVSKVFSRFGDLWVKIRRDRNAMPYAFCQFTKELDAARALTSGHGLEICGRPCRVERAKANRSVYLSRIAGGHISESEAREILSKEGPLEKLWYPTGTDKEVYRLSDGIWCTFAFFQDARDAQTTFKDNQEFRLEVPYSPEEHERKRISSFKFSPATITPRRGIRTYNWPGANRTMNNSVFIGSLPMGASIESIRESLEGCGTIRTIEIIGNQTSPVTGYNIWAFVEFANDGGVRAALASDIHVNGRPVRVEHRRSQENPHRTFSAVGSPHGRSPLTPRTPINDNNAPIKTDMATPNAMLPVYEGNNQQAQAQPQTPINPQMYNHAVAYGSPFPGYGSYYSPNQPESGQNTVPPFVPIPGQQPMMGQFPVPGFVPAQYSSPQLAYGYVYNHPVVTGDAPAANSNNPGTAHAQASPHGNAESGNGVSR